MTGCNDRYTVSTRQLSAESHIDDQGYLHTGRSQRQPDRIVVACSPRGAER